MASNTLYWFYRLLLTEKSIASMGNFTASATKESLFSLRVAVPTLRRKRFSSGGGYGYTKATFVWTNNG